MNFFTMLFPLAVNIFELYIKNSSSKKDDAVLEVVKMGASYLANKDNNTITKDDCIKLNEKKVLL
ncbi:hypothetical protein [Sulfurimonas sp. NWX367]|uniref:hypothetical protein n=1 Tax=Sulfurimonas sp. NWX367 TaxID=2925413 RepID=UPI003204A6F1